ncbi:MAG: hypothetical protein ABIR28_07370 [Vicinamibacteria bacterium]
MTESRTRFLAALATALGLIAGGFNAHVAPQGDGWWFGVTGTPSPGWTWFSLGASILVWLLGRVANVRALLLMFVGLLPLIPATTGMASGLLFFSDFTMILLLAMLLSVASRDLIGQITVGYVSVFLISLGFFVFVGRYVPGAAGPQGDEPHYLLIAESLIIDGDVDLKNQFDERAFTKFTSANLQPHTAPRSPAGTLYAIHTPGLSALIAPGYALGGFMGARAVLSTLMAGVVTLLFFVTKRLFDAATARFAFVLATFASPLPIYANSLFPDSAATLPVAATLACMVSRRPEFLALASASIAFLPWLHPRFLPLAFVLAIAVATRHGLSWARMATAFVPMLLSLAALLIHFNKVFGSATLSAAYGPGFSTDVSMRRIPWGASGLMMDRQFGLLLFAPVLLLGLFGVAFLWKRDRAMTAVAVSAMATLLGVGSAFTMWWGGASAPTRFLIGATPALLLLCAARWHAVSERSDQRALLAIACGFGLGLTWLACLAPRALHNRNDGESGLLRLLAPVLEGDRLFPGFVGHDRVWLAAVWGLVIAGLAMKPRLGAVMAGAAVALGSLTAAEPLLQPFPATLRALESWDDHRRTFGGVDDSSAFHLDVPLGRATWQLEAGSEMYSSRFSLPAGSWTLRVDSQSEFRPDALNVARVQLIADDDTETSLGSVLIEADKSFATTTLGIPTDERRVRLKATGIQSRTTIRSVRLIPDTLRR